jgi:hypothetical protein
MTQHTPGPWKYGPDNRKIMRVFSGSREIVRALSTHGNRRLNCVERAANARLIAAAPELLAALRPLAHMGDASIRSVLLAALRPHERESFIAATEYARAAVEKATGEQL